MIGSIVDEDDPQLQTHLRSDDCYVEQAAELLHEENLTPLLKLRHVHLISQMILKTANPSNAVNTFPKVSNAGIKYHF